MSSRYASAHASPQGPGDARPTASQIIQDEGLQGKWTDKPIFITGCSAGLGVETARTLFTTGATLYLTARNLAKAEKALGNELTSSDRVHLLELDLNSLQSVRECAVAFTARSDRLHILINNAGVMATPEGRTADGFETQFGTNHLAQFLLFNLLKPVLLASSTPEFNSRVVILSSVAHRFGAVNFDNINLEGAYHPFVAYSQSKTANVWTANEIERRYGSKGLHAWSVHPGGIFTGIGQHMSEGEQEALATDPGLVSAWKSPEQGAATTVCAAALKDLEGKPGRYLENCQVAERWTEVDGQWGPGYAGYAYDTEKEARLWKLSLEMVKLKDDINA